MKTLFVLLVFPFFTIQATSQQFSDVLIKAIQTDNADNIVQELLMDNDFVLIKKIICNGTCETWANGYNVNDSTAIMWAELLFINDPGGFWEFGQKISFECSDKDLANTFETEVASKCTYKGVKENYLKTRYFKVYDFPGGCFVISTDVNKYIISVQKTRPEK